MVAFNTWLLALGFSAYSAAAAAVATAQLTVTGANSTTRWEQCTGRACTSSSMQIYEVTVNNTGSTTWITSSDRLTVSIKSSGVRTVQAATIKRLMPGDSAIVEVGVQNARGVASGSSGSATAVASWNHGNHQTHEFTANFGIAKYTSTATSINTHQSPSWFRRAKFGIFIHWGVYSVPAYGSVAPNESYAEWYWSHQQSKSDKTQTYQYHLKTYGEKVVYDDFIANFTASKFNAKDWVDLIANSGAKYFVPTTKHHDGFALFEMPDKVSGRNSVALGPKRDLIKELFDASTKYQPQLVRGTYFSLPEWFNPAYTKYGDGSQFGVGPPKNPYNGTQIPYTGYTAVDDFVSDIQAPQMDILLNQYNTSIMWCDIGRASDADKLFSTWLNKAASSRHQVTFNSRCGTTSSGDVIGDYETPEYKPVNTFSSSHWEACRGMDPFSFGYNKFTPDDAYMNASAIVTTVVDITAKNGNLLLDIGPRADGTIPSPMSTGLLAAGKWFKAHAESIYDTKYWPINQGSGNFRYTITENAFYMHSLVKPTGDVVVPDKVPFLATDKVTVLGGRANGKKVPAKLNSDGKLVLTVSDAIAAADSYTWTFKIAF